MSLMDYSTYPPISNNLLYHVEYSDIYMVKGSIPISKIVNYSELIHLLSDHRITVHYYNLYEVGNDVVRQEELKSTIVKLNKKLLLV